MHRKEAALREFVRKVKERYGDKIEKIILYGSYARGEAEDESDIDVLIIGDVSIDELVDISFPILLKYGEHISHLTMSAEHFEFLDREGYGFIKSVKREGKVIYA
ncbi:MAG: nucleotidyltransferase domain-containing protein [Euryarchaeota archaeon]|nr:nucleotidyltransferase domain-containing protein [Euryarchaeota archaeon]